MGSITVRLHEETEAALRQIAVERSLPVSVILREAIEVWTNPRVRVDAEGKLVEVDLMESIEDLDRRMSKIEQAMEESRGY